MIANQVQWTAPKRSPCEENVAMNMTVIRKIELEIKALFHALFVISPPYFFLITPIDDYISFLFSLGFSPTP